MSPSAAPTVSHVDIQRSRQLVHDSRVLIATAKELIAQSRQSIARQRYFKIVCAWCQQTIRWQRTEGAAPGGSSPSLRPELSLATPSQNALLPIVFIS